VLVVATLTRPEGVVVAVVLTVLGLRHARRETVAAFAGYAAVVAAYEAWRVGYFGAWLPNTYYAKVSGGPLRFVRGVVYTAAFGVYFAVPVLPMALLGPRSRPAHPGTIVSAGVIAAWVAYVVWVGGDYMAMYRFFAPVVPLMYLLAGRAAAMAWGRRRVAVTAAVAFAVVATAIHSTPLDPILFPKPPRQHGHYGGVETERWHAARLTLLGRYFATRCRTGDESLATDAIGAIGYYSGLRVYGMHGLVDRYIAHTNDPRVTGLGVPGHERSNLRYILSREPTYVMISRLFTPAPGGYPEDLEPEASAILRRDYEPVSAWMTDDVNGESGYFTYYARRHQARKEESP
jgi:hypothetical protein